MAKYSKKAQNVVKKEVKQAKGKWKNVKQAVAVGISKARKKGLKVPKKSKK